MLRSSRLFILVMLMLAPVALHAEDVSPATVGSPAVAPSLPTSPSPADCTKSTLTGAQFIDLVHTIAMHGDLTDISFIEKTLGVKFTPHNDGKNGMRYEITSYLGTSIDISLRNYNKPNQKYWISRLPPKGLAEIIFDFGEQNRACAYIAKDKFDQNFTGYSIETEELYDILGPTIKDPKAVHKTTVTTEQNHAPIWQYASGTLTDVTGKYGSVTRIEYAFTPAKGIINYVTIQQTVAK